MSCGRSKRELGKEFDIVVGGREGRSCLLFVEEFKVSRTVQAFGNIGPALQTKIREIWLIC